MLQLPPQFPLVSLLRLWPAPLLRVLPGDYSIGAARQGGFAQRFRVEARSSCNAFLMCKQPLLGTQSAERSPPVGLHLLSSYLSRSHVKEFNSHGSDQDIYPVSDTGYPWRRFRLAVIHIIDCISPRRWCLSFVYLRLKKWVSLFGPHGLVCPVDAIESNPGAKQVRRTVWLG
jgi:hypothetical protein